MTKKKNRAGFAELASSVEALRETQQRYGFSDDAMESMLKDSEDGLAQGLGAVPPMFPSKHALDNMARVALMNSLTKLATLMLRRADEATSRLDVHKAA